MSRPAARPSTAPAARLPADPDTDVDTDPDVDPIVAALARVLDPVAFDARAEPRTLGQLWDQTCRRMTARQHARRALDAGWGPPPTSFDAAG